MTMTLSIAPPNVGTKMSFRKTMTVAEQAMFTGISGNLDPLHVDQRAARAAGFTGVLAFELAVAALATTSLNRLAGPNWRIGAVRLEFPMPVVVGDTVEAVVEVVSAEAEKIECTVACLIKGNSDAIAVTGSASLVPLSARG